MAIMLKEAVDAYGKALHAVGVDRSRYQFRVANGQVCIGHMWGKEADEVQWGMRWHTAEELFRMAKMRRLDFPPVKRIGKRFVDVDRESL